MPPTRSISTGFMACAAAAAAVGLIYAVYSRRKSATTIADESSTMTGSRKVRFADDAVDPKVQEGFSEAASKVRSIDSSFFSNGDRLLLYALYKQATKGDAPEQPKVGLDIVRYQKQSAWWKLRNMKSQEAAARYIVAVDEIATRTNPADDLDDDMLADSSPFAPAVSLPVAEDGPSVDSSKIDTKEHMMLSAAGSGDTSRLEELLQEGVDVRHRDSTTGETALHLSADKGYTACVQLLLKNGADIHACDVDGISILQAAVIAGHVNVCKVLVENGADPDVQDVDGDSPRSCAADDGSRAMRKLFRSLPRQSP